MNTQSENISTKKVGYVSNNLYNSEVIFEVYEEKQTAKFYFSATKASATTDYACFAVYNKKRCRDEEFLTYEKAKQYYDSL